MIAGIAFLLVSNVVAESPVQFNRDIRPILSEKCFACHGPDAASREGDLRLDREEDAKAGDVIIPGKAGKSKLIQHILSSDPDEQMPPPDSHKELSSGEKQLLADWIDGGAKWEGHWAFISPQRPTVPKADGAGKWSRNPVDQFVLAKLEKLNLKPNEEADKYTLARRAALDITGLPPEKAARDAFLSDKNRGAFTRYVDVLLASKQAAEHRARYWLDAARFGDTHGMHVDNYREMWPYRDWVIRAFNNKMPFDQFIVEQLAGDLLPSPTLEQRIATGFSRCNITTSEGGAIPEELAVRYMIDRVETTATVFLGLTVGCAVCHDHKFDPISQKEFYSLGAFFNNTTQPVMDGNEKDSPPVVVMPDVKLKPEWDELLARRSDLRKTLQHESPQADLEKWWGSHKPMGVHPVIDDDLLLWLPLIESKKDQLDLPKKGSWAAHHPAGKRGIRFEKGAGLEASLPKLNSDDSLSISFWVRAPDQLLGTTLFEQMASVEVPQKDGKKSKKQALGWKISSSNDGSLKFTMSDGKGGTIFGNMSGEEALTPRQWQHVCVRYSGGRAKTAVSVVVNGENRRLRNSTQAYCDVVDLKSVPLKLGSNLPSGGLSDIRIFRRWLTGDEVQVLADEFELRKELNSKGKWSDLKPEQQKMLARYRANSLDTAHHKASLAFGETQKRRDFIHSRSTTTLVMEERQDATPRAWVLNRGEYDQRKEEVKPAVPAALIPFPKDAKPDRLGLAKWLVSPQHSLTARVTVNRLWQSLFGTGLVKTSEDFGVMGERPSHRELLDWLAVEFIESGWDIDHIFRIMLTSAVYRQSGRANPEKHVLDPENRHLARGPRLRLDAEILRDQALSVSGLLVTDIGGPSVKPYQPDGLWNVVAITGSNTREFKRDSGNALFRRSLYTFWKRTSPPPSMSAFNAPTREQCTVRRERTNTPLQALVMLNDPQFVEAARNLAEHTLKSADNDKSRVTWILQRVLSRPANPVDVADVTATVTDFRKLFSADPAAAKKLIETGESKADSKLPVADLAAWTMAANVLLNRDDFINKN